MAPTDTFLLQSGIILANEVPERDSLAFTISSPLEMLLPNFVYLIKPWNNLAW